MTTDVGPVEQDGRTARAERTRVAIAEALLALLEEGNLHPGTGEIAARAGVSERTIFGHYSDREALMSAVAELQTERVVAMLDPPVPETGPLDARLDAFVAQRAALLEAVTPVRRAALLNEPFSEVVAAGLRRFRAFKRHEAHRVFARELDAVPMSERAGLEAALGAATAWTSWEALRAHQGLSHPAAQAVMRQTLAALLARV